MKGLSEKVSFWHLYLPLLTVGVLVVVAGIIAVALQ